MKRLLDDDYELWKPGDLLVWDEDEDGPLFPLARIDEHERVFWLDHGEEHMTRATNMWRVRLEQVVATERARAVNAPPEEQPKLSWLKATGKYPRLKTAARQVANELG